jgi:hypothetical protein
VAQQYWGIGAAVLGPHADPVYEGELDVPLALQTQVGSPPAPESAAAAQLTLDASAAASVPLSGASLPESEVERTVGVAVNEHDSPSSEQLPERVPPDTVPLQGPSWVKGPLNETSLPEMVPVAVPVPHVMVKEQALCVIVHVSVVHPPTE